MFSTEWLTVNYSPTNTAPKISLETYPLYSVTEFTSATAFARNSVKK